MTSTNENSDENIVEVKVFNIAKIHHYDSDYRNIVYETLAGDEVDDTLFEQVTIRAIIEQKWESVKKPIILYLLIPYTCFVLTLSFYVIYDYEVRYDAIAIILRILILIFVGYFVFIEVFQYKREGFTTHFTDFWNYLDILPPILIVLAEVLNVTGAFDSGSCENGETIKDENGEDVSIQCYKNVLIRSLYAFTSFFVWLRFLYFFRVFKSTGYYIKMIIEVIKDMG